MRFEDPIGDIYLWSFSSQGMGVLDVNTLNENNHMLPIKKIPQMNVQIGKDLNWGVFHSMLSKNTFSK